MELNMKVYSHIQKKDVMIRKTELTYLAPISLLAEDLCVDKEKRKFEPKNLFGIKKFSCALACCNQLTLGNFSTDLKPSSKLLQLHKDNK